jgi:hypothetical protein
VYSDKHINTFTTTTEHQLTDALLSGPLAAAWISTSAAQVQQTSQQCLTSCLLSLSAIPLSHSNTIKAHIHLINATHEQLCQQLHPLQCAHNAVQLQV